MSSGVPLTDRLTTGCVERHYRNQAESESGWLLVVRLIACLTSPISRRTEEADHSLLIGMRQRAMRACRAF
jgi:hypothetical protein